MNLPGSTSGLTVQRTPRVSIASRHDSISSGADHGGSYLEAPPVRLAADGVLDHWKKSLLEIVSDGSVGVQTPPSGDIAGEVMGQEGFSGGQAGGLHRVAHLHGLGQLDERDVVKDEEGVPLLMNNDLLGRDGGGSFFLLLKVVLSDQDSVDAAGADTVSSSQHPVVGDQGAPAGVSPVAAGSLVLQGNLPWPTVFASVNAIHHPGQDGLHGGNTTAVGCNKQNRTSGSERNVPLKYLQHGPMQRVQLP